MAGPTTSNWQLTPSARRTRAGQSLVETCLAIALLGLIFFGLLQIAQLFVAQEVLQYAATRGLRAKAVGFNRFMVTKTIRVGAIANAGRLVTPPAPRGLSGQAALERTRIPLYLEAGDAGQLPAILDYENWDSIEEREVQELSDGTLALEVEQKYPLRFPLHRAFYAGDTVPLRGRAYLENHYTLYLYDLGW